MRCKRCVYDHTVPGISFDKQGVCNYCHQQDELEKEYPTGREGARRLKKLADEIKKAGKGKKYDCVIGVSGGCDSSMLLHLAKKLGLRPLAVHFDNTWNSIIAVENIAKVLTKLDIDLYTYVVDNDEFNDMARAMMLSSVPEIDALTDIALATVLYMACEKYKIKYILNGHSFRTEGIGPIGLYYFDGKYIADIYQKFGNGKMKTFPNLWFGPFIKWIFMGVKRVRPLYYIDYRKKEARKFLNKKYGWQWYGGHHWDNRYTLFTQYYLLEKYDIDLRHTEASAMVRAGQMTREEALQFIKKPFEIEGDVVDEIKDRLKLSDKEYAKIMKAPKKSAKDYKTYRKLFKLFKPFFFVAVKLKLVPMSFYVKYC
jgi:N-acetyl sugar amidotransferase